MKIADYEQMMAHLMRQGYNRGGYVRLKDGGRIGLKFGGKPLTTEQKQAIVDAYNNFKKQKKFLPNLTDVVESLPKAKHNNLYRVKQVLNEKKLKYSSAINPEKRKAADKVRVEAQKEKADPFKNNKAQENKFIKDVEKRYEFPKLSTAAKEAGVLSNPELAKKYGVSERKVDRLVEKYAKDLNYPKQTLEGEAKKKSEQKIRRDKLIKEVSDKKVESKIRDIKKGEKGIDLAHKASLRQFKDLGLEYYVDNLGFDKSKVNQELIIPTEQKMESLHKQRMKILKKAKPNEVPKNIQEQLEKINLKMSKLSLQSDGVLQAVLVDEKTLKPFVFNKNYAGTIGQGLIDKPVSEMTGADLDLIKAQKSTQIKNIKRAPQSSGPTLGANIGLLKGVGETIKAIPTPTGAVALNLAFQPDLSSGIDRAALGAEAAFAPELVRQTSRVSSAPIVQRFFNLGLSPQLAARAARVVSPLGLATLAGEGVYQLGRLGAEQRRIMREMTPEQRRLFDAEQQSISEFAAAGGGIAKLAGKESGPPPEKGPDSEGLASLLKNVKKR